MPGSGFLHNSVHVINQLVEWLSNLYSNMANAQKLCHKQPLPHSCTYLIVGFRCGAYLVTWLGFKIFVKNEDFKFQVKCNVKIS